MPVRPRPRLGAKPGRRDSFTAGCGVSATGRLLYTSWPACY